MLRSDEKVLVHWSSPGGRGVLTDQRCLLLSHPDLLHRRVEWERDLEKVESLTVVALHDDPEVVRYVSQTLAGSTKYGDPTTGIVNTEFKLLVDEVTVLLAGPDRCGEIQARVDDARNARCLALFGQIVPYKP